MQYTFDEALQESLRRAALLRRRRNRLQTGALSAAVVVLLGAVLTAGAGLTRLESPVMGESVYGAFLLPNAAGGYILAGVAAFVIGVLVTLLCIHLRGEQTRRGTADREAGEPEPIPPERSISGESRRSVPMREEKQELEYDKEGEMR